MTDEVANELAASRFTAKTSSLPFCPVHSFPVNVTFLLPSGIVIVSGDAVCDSETLSSACTSGTMSIMPRSMDADNSAAMIRLCFMLFIFSFLW